MPTIRWNGREALTLARVMDVSDPAVAMQRLVRELLDEAEQDSPPVDLRLVASFQDIAGIEAAVMQEAALIVKRPDGLHVVVNTNDIRVRQNFSIAHEICHTLFPHFRFSPEVRDRFVGTFSVRQEEEWLCDSGASLLLLPPHLLRSRALDVGLSLDALFELSESFQASIEATALAWAALDLWPAAVILFEERLKPSEAWRTRQMAFPELGDGFLPQPELRVALACVPSSLGLFIPKHKSVSRNGPIYAALRLEGRTSGDDELYISGANRTLMTESAYAPFTKDGSLQGRVVTVAYFDKLAR